MSVIVPCRNCAHVISEQLEALIAQEVPVPWELIVVDDGSTDGTANQLRAWRDRLSNLRVVSLTDGGSPAIARNVGLEAARGERVLFCDADDVVQPGWITALLTALHHHDVAGGALALSALNPQWPARVTARPPDDALPLSADHLPFAHTGNLGVHKGAAIRLGGFDVSMHTSEDQDFSWRALRAGLQLGFAGDALVQVRMPTTLLRLWKQRITWGIGSVDLYVRHADHMPGPRSAAEVARELGRLALSVPRASVSRPHRFHLVTSLAFFVGRVRGSIKNRTAYL